MKRLFAGLKIHPDGEFLAKYRELKHALRQEHIKWVEDQNIHVTLKFLGETEDGEIPGICSLLEKRASVTTSFDLRLAGIGIFGSSYAPKVIWAGIEPYSELVAVMKNIHGDLQSIGFEADRQNLVPHLTLGRIKNLEDRLIFRRTIDLYKAISSSPESMNEAILYESILRGEGPEYIVLEKFPFIKKQLP